MARRKTLEQNVEEFVDRSIKRHVRERRFDTVAEDFDFLGRFHLMRAEEAAFNAGEDKTTKAGP